MLLLKNLDEEKDVKDKDNISLTVVGAEKNSKHKIDQNNVIVKQNEKTSTSYKRQSTHTHKKTEITSIKIVIRKSCRNYLDLNHDVALTFF